MKLETEAEIVQNPALGAALLWAFTAEFHEAAQNGHGPLLPFLNPVLPMVLHRETVQALHRRHKSGGLDLALAENRTLVIDLQDRMQQMLPQTMQSLNLAFGSSLLRYQRETGQVLPERATSPFRLGSQEVHESMSTARRLGYWFCTINTQRLCALLRIRI